LKHALSIGYTIIKYIDVWEYQTKSNDLFFSFIKPFLIKKIISKKDGLVNYDTGTFTSKGNEMKLYLQDLCDINVSPDDFTNSPAERTIAKLIMNSFYGKWGQRSTWSEIHNYCCEKDIQKCLKVICDSTIDIQYAEAVSHNNKTYVVIEYEKKNAVSRGDSSKNDHIAAFITAYGRIMLNRLVQELGENVLYTDTDSAFYNKIEMVPFNTGYKIGDLELELKDGRCWVGLGRKSYSYYKGNDIVCKQKGISLKKSLVPLFSPEKFKQLLFDSKIRYDLYEGEHNQKVKKMCKESDDMAIKASQVVFDSVKENVLWMKKTTRIVEKRTNYLMWSLKRVPMWETSSSFYLDTQPFGYNVANT